MVVLGLCILSAYLIRRNRFYYLPESAAAILVGVVVGGMAKLFYPTKDELDFLSFNSVRDAVDKINTVMEFGFQGQPVIQALFRLQLL